MNRHRALLACLLMAVAATPLHATWDEGVAAFRAGRYEDTAAAFRSYVAHSPKAPQGHYMLGLSLMSQGRHAEALGPLGEALALAPDDIGCRLALADALLKAGQPKDAFATLEAQDPAAVTGASRANFNQLLARAAEASGRDDDAFVTVGKALAADGGSRDLWVARANLANRLERPEDAFTALSKVFEIDPSDAKPGVGAVHAAMDVAGAPGIGDDKLAWYVKAAGVADRVAASFPTPENLRLAGAAAMGAKEYERSIGYFERLLAAEGRDPLLHYELGRCRQALGDSRKALDHYRAALERSPDAELAAGIHARRGKALRVLEDFTGAAAAFRLAGDADAASEMEGYAENRREWAKAKADCFKKRTGLEDLIAASGDLEHTREYQQLQRDLETILDACKPYFEDAG